MPDLQAAEHFVLLANPVAGSGAAPRRSEAVASALRAAGARATVHLTAGLADARAGASSAAADGAVVVAAGGDGLVGAVAGTLAAEGGVFGVVPCGRGNDFARELALPDDDAGLARVLLAPGERRVDVLDVAGRIVVGSVATGIDADADARVHRRPRVPVGLAYRLAALRSLAAFRFPTYTVTVDDGEPLRVPAYTVVVANGRAYGAGLQVAPGAVVDDGRLDVVVIGAFSRRGFPRLLEQLRTGAHLARDEVTALRGRTVTVAADRPLHARADGEALGALPLTVSVRPGALRVRSGPLAV